MTKLTAQQERFAQALADGMTQADAYRTAYKTAGKAQTVIENASRLMADSNVAARVAELKQALAEKLLWTREQSVSVLAEIAGAGSNNERVSAVKELNQMHGFNAPTRHELAVHGFIKIPAKHG